MSEVSLTTRVKRMLNKCLPAAWAAKLGDRLYEMESYGVLAHSYANGHAAKTYAFADLPIAPIVRITLTLADAAADLILPAATNKVYIINNTSGQTITVKCADQTGTALANNGRYVCWSNGTDIITSVPEVTLAGAQTLVNKTLTSPVLTTPKIADGDAGLTVTSANQTNAGATATVPDIGDAADEFVMKDTTQTLTNKTLTAPTLATPKIADGGTGLTITSADQTHASATATVPNFTGAAEEFVMKGMAQTLTSKTLTAPIMTSPDITLSAASHDYDEAAVDWLLSAAEAKNLILRATNADGAVNAIVPDTANKPYMVVNGTGQVLTIKTAAGTGIAIANAKAAMVMSDGTNVIRLTPDA